MELLEREALLAALDGLLDAAASGSGNIALLAGEAGIGKTSLVRAFCARHEQDAYVWWGACDALSTPRPLGPLYDIARAAGAEFAALMASEADRSERFSGLLDALSATPRPVIAVIEDVHWADDATRDLIVFIARRITGTRAVVVITYRDDEVAAGHPLRVVLGNATTSASIHRMHVPRLSEEAVAQLAAGHEADAKRVYQITGGNPFFVTEVLGNPADDIPETVKDAVLARVARRSTTARATLDAVAVVPYRAEVSLVQAIVGGDATIDECEQHGVLRVDGRWVGFRHELARLAVEQAIPAARASSMHARALAHLAAQPRSDLARLAYHAEAARDASAVLTYAPAAAEQAAAIASHREAAAHYERALYYRDELQPHDEARLLERYAEQCILLSRAEDASDAADLALAIWRDLGDDESAGRVLARRSHFLWSAAHNQTAHESARSAVALLEARPPSPALAAAYAWASYLRMLARDIPGAIDMGTRAIELAQTYGERALLARALNAVGSAQWFADPDRAETMLGRSLDVARDSGDEAAVSSAMTNLGSGAGEIRRYAVAERWLREGIDWCTKRDLDADLHYCRSWQARTYFEQGRWSHAGALASEMADSPALIARMVALTALGRLRTRRGDPGGATLLEKAWELATRTGDLQRLWPVAAGRAEDAWLAGKPQLIAAVVGESLELAISLGHEWQSESLPTGCGWPERWRPHQPAQQARTRCRSTVTGSAPQTPGRSWAARTNRHLHLPTATSPLTCSRRWASSTASAPDRSLTCLLRGYGILGLRGCRAGRGAARSRIQPASPTVSSKCSGCSRPASPMPR